MLVKKVKLVAIGEPVAYPKKENGMIVKDEFGNDVTAGYRRQVLFESRDYKKDSIPVTVFSDTRESPFSVGMEGDLQFLCEVRESKKEDGESRLYAEIKLINFTPS